jgi:hypothetical protein
MGKSLKELVSAALENADNGMKVASAADVIPQTEDADFLADELSLPSRQGPTGKQEAKADPPAGKTASDQDVLDSAAFAMKLASALDVAVPIVTKLAAEGMPANTHSHLSAPGPAVMASEHIHSPGGNPVAQNNSLSAAASSHSGGPMHNGQTGPSNLDTNSQDFSTVKQTGPEAGSGALKQSAATAALVKAKVAQARTLESLGQLDAAERLLEEAVALRDKVAADPSSPQPSGLTTSPNPGKLDMEPPASTQIMDNSGLIAATKGSMRDSNTRQAGAFFSEKPAVDNAVAAHVGKTDGLKTSAVKTAVTDKYLAKKLVAAHQRAGSLSSRALPGLQRKSYEMILGGSVGPSHRKAVFGAAADGIRARSKGKLHEMRTLPARMRKSVEAGMEAGQRDAMRLKGAAQDPAMHELAARVYLKKVAALADDPEAPIEERQKAASLIQAVRASTGQENPLN